MTNIDSLPDTTRLWVYQSNRPFKQEELPMVKTYLDQFVKQWVSHNNQLSALGEILHDRFILLMVDENQAGASGCSIDASVHFLKSLQAEFGVDLFDRMRFSFQQGEQVKTVSRDEFASLYASGAINDDTLVFDTLVNNKKAFEEGWLKPLKESWHHRMV
ncbi:MAG: hypothetical protein DHS20C18_16790 [Saprospiraceae bacterium]|nr:MAG: hypothetical protein DHS20C18_16790 [Saprospiraceae bacterium]